MVELSEVDEGAELEEELRQAVRRGKDAAVKRLLKRRVSPDAGAPSNGRTALHFACYAAEAGCVRMLLDAGADPAVVNVTGDTALHHVALGDSLLGSRRPGVPAAAEIARLLLAKGADREALNNAGLRAADVGGISDELFAVLDAEEQQVAPEPEAAGEEEEWQQVEKADVLEVPVATKELVPLALPHPTVSADLVPELLAEAERRPDAAARRALAALEEVLMDVVDDNFAAPLAEALHARPHRTSAYADALSRSALLPPGTRDALAATVAVSKFVAEHGDGWQANAAGARRVIKALFAAVQWATAGGLKEAEKSSFAVP